MSWQPEDWSEWLVERRPSAWSDGGLEHAVREILLRLPDREQRFAVELTRGTARWLSFLEAHFARASAVVWPDGAAALAAARACHLLLAVDAIDVADLTPALGAIRGVLAEGGVLLATFPASARGGPPFEMLARPRASGLHEVQLQYRLRGAGFQGLRMRRLGGAARTLLCMAVRRALN